MNIFDDAAAMDDGLERWRIPAGSRGEEQFDALLAHPQFAAAARQLGRNMLALAGADRALDGIVKDAGRFAATGLAMYLHASGGLTLGRLKDVCAETGVASPGRARAVLLFLRFLRYIEPAGEGARAGRYVPTRALTEAWRAIGRALFGAAELCEPALAVLTARLDETVVVETLARIEGEMALGLFREGRGDNALWRVFLNRYAGTQILHALMLSAGEDGPYPPEAEIGYSLSRLAREFHVSRPHVARLLKAAEQEGLVTLCDDKRLRFTSAGREAIRTMLALRLASAILAAIRLRDALADAPLAKAG